MHVLQHAWPPVYIQLAMQPEINHGEVSEHEQWIIDFLIFVDMDSLLELRCQALEFQVGNLNSD